MRRATILLAILMVLSSAVVFADDEKPAKEGLKEISQDVMKAAREVGKVAKKSLEEVNKAANKILKKDGKDKQDNKKAAKD